MPRTTNKPNKANKTSFLQSLGHDLLLACGVVGTVIVSLLVLDEQLSAFMQLYHLDYLHAGLLVSLVVLLSLGLRRRLVLYKEQQHLEFMQKSLEQQREQLEAEKKDLAHQATQDPLTELPNRALLFDRLKQALNIAPRHRTKVAVLLFDLDAFKPINDNYGHEVGDRVLKQWSANVRRSLRDCDTLARLGGDEFVAVLTDISLQQTKYPFLDRLLEASSQRIRVGSFELKPSASLGAYFVPEGKPGNDQAVEEVLKCAENAMYEAKSKGRGRYHVYAEYKPRLLRGRAV